MAQMLIQRKKNGDIVLFQDLFFSKKKSYVRSTANEAVCVVCSKGIGDGVSVTAKRLGQKTRLFCHFHIS
ncbi:MAG: hypothetical protein KGI33_02720 [Thaumarchaeota archaeon]|nr:hypothetical protein [Nitrososphaerota archaeon]